jgi:hypothetical protein
MPKITARQMLECAASQRFLGSSHWWFERYRCSALYPLRKTASADALPLPLLLQCFGFLNTSVARRLDAEVCAQTL